MNHNYPLINNFSPYDPLSDSDNSDDDISSYYTTSANEDGDRDGDETDMSDMSDTDVDTDMENVNPPILPDRSELYRKKAVLKKVNDIVTNDNYADYIIDGFSAAGTGKANDENIINFKQTQFQTAVRPLVSLLNISSSDRDKKAYPQPTNFKLRLPREYKNITQLQFTQIRLLSSFLYFRDNKFNTFFKVYEHGRIENERTVDNNPNKRLELLVKIREGSYNINELLNELTIQMNTTPPFFYFPGGLTQFSSIFTINGDLALNFNQPGDYFYNSLTDTYIQNPTLDSIIGFYFPTRFVTQLTYTYDNIIVAYYYPVLKEAFLDPLEIENINSTISGYTFDDIYNRVIYDYNGLSDTVIAQLIKQNISELDSYRTTRSFVNSFINKYIWGLQTFNNRVFVNSNSLNSSIIKDITRQETNFINTALSQAGLSISGYTSLVSTIYTSGVLLTSLYDYMQRQMASNFGITFGSVTIPALANTSTLLNIQNGTNISGIFTQFSEDYSNAISTGLIVIDPNYAYSPPPQTPDFPFYLSPTPTFSYTDINNQASLRNFPYDFTLKDINTDETFIDTSGNIYVNPKDRSGTTIAYVDPGKYAVFRFRSNIRQTMQIETLPVPFYYKYPNYNMVFSGEIPYFFNKTYAFTDISLTDFPSISTNLTTIGPIPFGIDLSAAIIDPIFSTNYLLNVTTRDLFFTFQTPNPIITVSGTITYKYPLNIQINIPNISIPAPVPILIALYHDRAAFMTDAYYKTISRYNTIYQTSIPIGQQTSNFSLNTFANNDYYLIVRVNDTAFADIYLNVYVYWDSSFNIVNVFDNLIGDITQGLDYSYQDPVLALQNELPNTANYGFTQTNDTDWQHLPSDSTLFPPNPNDKEFNIVYPSSAPFIGYDICGISTDLTDYKGWLYGDPNFQPDTEYRIDPITNYKFQTLSGYSQQFQQFIYPSTNNAILTPGTNNPYIPTYNNTYKREYKIVHWYDTHLIAPQLDDSGYDISGLLTFSTIKTYDTSAATISGYTYTNISGFTNPVLTLGKGVYGISFLPTDGWWDIERFQFKSAYCKAGGPNEKIAYIGIYDTHNITHKSINTIQLGDAKAILSSSKTVYYSTFTQVAANEGFDPTLGAYYEFTKLPVSNYSSLYNRHDLAAEGFSGYTSYPSTIINHEESFYSAIPFDSVGNIVPYFMLTGSLVPYPNNSNISICGTYLGTTIPPMNGVQTDMIVPTVSGVFSKNIYQSQYEQSLAAGTQLLQFKDTLDVFNDITPLPEYDLYLNATGNPDFRLRTTWYKKGVSQYLIAGAGSYSGGGSGGYSATNISGYVGDIYEIRNPGTDSRDTCFIQQFDLRLVVPPTQFISNWTTDISSAYILTVSGPVGISKRYNVYKYDDLVNTISGSATFLSSFDSRSLDTSITVDISSSMYVNYDSVGNRCVLFTYLNAVGRRCICLYKNILGINYFTKRTFSGSVFKSISINPTNLNSYCILYVDSFGDMRVDIIGFAISSPVGPDAYGQYLGTEQIINSIKLISPIATSMSEIYMGISGNVLPIYIWNNTLPSKILRVVDIYGAESQVESSQFSITGANEAQSGYGMSIGFDGNGGVWVQEQFGTFFDEDPWRIYGSSQLAGETSYGLINSWQIFYPTIKITFTKRANSYNAINNLTEINYYNDLINKYYTVDNPNYPIYNHTKMFLYENYSSMIADLSGVSGWKWGQEQNYMRADISFSGYYFNSYIYNATLEQSPPLTGDEDYYYLVVRGHMPSEGFQTMVRFTLPERYDYGFISIPELINEISGSTDISNQIVYNPDYSQTISTFNSAFVLSNFSPGGLLNPTNLPDISFNGFPQFYSTFLSTYTTYAINKSTITGITDSVRNKSVEYLSTFYSNILPSSQFTKANLKSPVRFDLLFKSSIPPQIESRTENWGLGWNLGFPKQDLSSFVSLLETDNCKVQNGTTEIQVLGGGGTSYTANSFYKILDDYIYLRLNDEFSLNRVDTSSPENLAKSLDPTGQTNRYFAKLLLANFGSYAQTMIQNPIILNPPIGKLDKITFNLVDNEGQIISNNDCEWSATVQITESIETATLASILPTTTTTIATIANAAKTSTSTLMN